MRPSFFATALAAGVLLTGPSARAQLWLDARAGVGVSGAAYEFQAPYDHLGETGHLRERAGVVAVPMQLVGRGGIGVTRQFGVGLLARGEIAPFAPTVDLNYGSLKGHAFVGIGPTLAVRPHGGLELAASLEWNFGGIWGDQLDIGAPDNVFHLPSLSGVGGSLAFGCCAKPGFIYGLEGRLAYLTGEHTTYVPVSLGLLFGASTW